MKKSLPAIFVCTLLTACTSLTTLAPGANKVVVSQQPAPKTCHYLGQVHSEDINGVTFAYTSDENMDQREVISLKNQAAKLGANLVASAHETETYGKAKANRPATLDQQITVGEAYQCPNEVLASMKAIQSS